MLTCVLLTPTSRTSSRLSGYTDEGQNPSSEHAMTKLETNSPWLGLQLVSPESGRAPMRRLTPLPCARACELEPERLRVAYHHAGSPAGDLAPGTCPRFASA